MAVIDDISQQLETLSIDELETFINEARVRIRILHRQGDRIRDAFERQARSVSLSKEEAEFLFGKM
jgi:hypothetical protein